MRTIVLADDHVVVREGLRHLLECDPTLVVVGEAATGTEALSLVRRQKPDVVILDLKMPGMNGLETTRRVTSLNLSTRVVVLTMYSDEAYLLEALEGGASGFVVKESAGADLFQAIRDVTAGRLYVSPLLGVAFRRRFQQVFKAALVRRPNLLTKREREVSVLASDGLSSRRIGVLLRLTIRQVESHLARSVLNLGLNTAHISRLREFANSTS